MDNVGRLLYFCQDMMKTKRLEKFHLIKILSSSFNPSKLDKESKEEVPWCNG
jgi:hypothetical protein